MSAAEFDGVTLEQADLVLRQYDRVALGMLLETHQALVTRLDAETAPYAADTARTDLGAGQAQLVGDALRAVRREAQRVVEDFLLDLGCNPVRVRMPRPALLLDEGGHAADLEGPAHLVEGVAVVAHDPAGLRDVAELLGQLQ